MVQTTKTRPPAQQQQPAAETTALRQIPEGVLQQIEELADRYSLERLAEAGGRLRQAAVLAQGIQALRAAIGRNIGVFLPLMNSPLGFLTDRPSQREPTPYPAEVVTECLTEALLRGFMPFGNEFNIIAARCFGALAGYQRKLLEVPGITDVRVAPGIPLLRDQQLVVRVAVSWKLGDQPGQLLGPDGKPGMPFAVSGRPDAAIGKARRRAFKAAWEQITGSRQTLPDREVGEAPDVLVPVLRGSDLPDRPGLPAREPAPADVRRRVNDLAAALEMGPEALAAEYAELGYDPQDPSPEGDAALLASLERRAGRESGMGE